MTEECCICLEELYKDDDLQLSCCNQYIHYKCFSIWALKSDVIFKCPLCNQSIYNPQVKLLNLIIKFILNHIKKLNESILFRLKLIFINESKKINATTFNVEYKQILSQINIIITFLDKRIITYTFDMDNIPEEIDLIWYNKNFNIFNFETCRIAIIKNIISLN